MKPTGEKMPHDVGEGLNQLNLISGIGISVRQHRVEDARLTRLMKMHETEDRSVVSAPTGFAFAVTAIGNKFEVAVYAHHFGCDSDSGWEPTTQIEFSDDSFRGRAFVAKFIKVEGPHSAEPGEVYAYGSRTDDGMRCRITSENYYVGLVPESDIPSKIITRSDIFDPAS